jgi:ubiquinone/menaquinone biosynthesis C-methylase UbiE
MEPGSTTSIFRDHFSICADVYSRARPGYPDALFKYLAAWAPARECAWDCGTGSGQAALGLAEHFDRVEATDASPEQIRQARSHERIRFRVAVAESSGLPDQSCDLVSIAQAIHWFDLQRFYAEARRVLRPRGVIAAYGYTEFYIRSDIDAVVRETLLEPLAGFCPPENRVLWSGYNMADFPFSELPKPILLAMYVDWTVQQLLDYSLSWSGTQRRIAKLGNDFLTVARHRLCEVWGDADRPRPVVLPLTVRIGRVADVTTDPR